MLHNTRLLLASSFAQQNCFLRAFSSQHGLRMAAMHRDNLSCLVDGKDVKYSPSVIPSFSIFFYLDSATNSSFENGSKFYITIETANSPISSEINFSLSHGGSIPLQINDSASFEASANYKEKQCAELHILKEFSSFLNIT